MSRNSRLENASNAEIDAVLSELETKLDRLKVAYERYFSGIDRTPPEFLRKDVVRILRMLENSFVRNTAQKFRLNTCSQKYSTYSNYWNRIQRQIEEGTFKRDLQKARRNEQRRTRQPADDEPKDDVYELDLDADFDADEFLNSFQNEFADSIDTLFDRSTGPTVLSKSPFDRDEQAPTTLVPSQFDRSQQAPTTLVPSQFDRSQQAPTTLAAHAFNRAETTESTDRQAKLDAMRRRLEERRQPTTQASPAPTADFARDEQPATRKATNEVPGMPTGGADYDKLRKLRQMKQRLEEQQTAPNPPQPRVVQRSAAHPAATPASTPPATSTTGPQRVIQRRAQPAQPSDNDAARDVYNKLVEAKRRCNEPTANLTFETVQRSMEQQRDRLRQSHGARDVDFQVVIKDGKAYLKPETKK